MEDDNVYRQNRQKINPEEVQNNSGPLDSVEGMQKSVEQEKGESAPKPPNFANAPFEMKGNIPPELKEAMQKQGTQTPNQPQQAQQAPNQPQPQKSATGSDELETLLAKLSSPHQWEEFDFPSKGKFYTDIPETIHVRPMTGEEEQILATSRFVKKGKAVDMIFNRCIQENIPTENLLSVDRTNLLIYLRGISYTPQYDVEIKCPECGVKFSTIIDLGDLDVEFCPNEFNAESLTGNLPQTGFSYQYRLATGADEQDVTNYRDKRIQAWGDQGEDDTLLYRTALLLERIEGVTRRREIQHLLKKLPISDVVYLRNEINEPPFGVDTEVDIICPSCTEDFKIDMPLETNFFFPRKKKEQTRA